MHGRESLRGPLEGPPTICGPRLVQLMKFVPQDVDAFPSQTGPQHDMGGSARGWHWQQMQRLGIGSGRELTRFDTVAVALVHEQDVAHFNHAALDALDIVPGPANQGEHEHVHHVPHGDFALPDAHGLHQNQIVACGLTELDGF